jgi:hypothetical protein
LLFPFLRNNRDDLQFGLALRQLIKAGRRQPAASNGTLWNVHGYYIIVKIGQKFQKRKIGGGEI